MPAMRCAWPDVLGSVCAVDNRDGTNLLRVSAEGGGLPIVQSGGRGGVAADALSEIEQRGEGGPGWEPPPPPPTVEDQTYRVSLPEYLLRTR